MGASFLLGDLKAERVLPSCLPATSLLPPVLHPVNLINPVELSLVAVPQAGLRSIHGQSIHVSLFVYIVELEEAVRYAWSGQDRLA